MKLKKILLVLALLALLAAFAGGHRFYSLTGSTATLCLGFSIMALVIILLYMQGNKAIIGEINEPKEAEGEIRKLNEELEEGVTEDSAELFESEQRHRSLSEASADPIVVYDLAARVTYVNPAFSQTFGWSIDELKGKSVDFVSEENRQEIQEALERMLRGKKVQSFDTRRLTKEGRLLDVELRTSLFFDRDGHPAGNIVILRDVTESRRRERALRESEKQYRNLVDNALVGIYKTDLEGNILYANEALIEMLGFESYEDMKSVGVLARYSNLGDRDTFIKSIKEIGKVNDFEVDLLTKSGGVKNVILTGVLEGDVISGMVLDITDRKQAVEELIRLATAVEQAAESVIISDRRGTIHYVNPAFERLSGFSSEDIVGKNFRILKSESHDKSFYREMWQTISRGKAWAGRISNRMKDGSLRQFETTISPLRDRNGAIVNFVSVNRDVTQEVALEAQLFQAQKMEAVGTLAGGIAHDFNNLLQVIQGYTEVLQGEVERDKSSFEALQKIHRSAKRGAELTRQLLTFSRKVQSERRPLDLNREVEQVKRLLERTIPKMIEIEL
ncbi:MAG: PAS domain S-box protein, partial [Deltaproteobacteria bacterium]